MSNVLSTLQPVLFAAARAVPRELIGACAGVQRDFSDKGVAQGDPVKIPVVPQGTVGTVSSAATFPLGNDRSPSTVQLTLNQTAEYSWNLKPEEERSLQNAGVAQDVLAQTIVQGIRSIVNQMENYLVLQMVNRASRAYGTAGTTPFGTSIQDAAGCHQILHDNGAGQSGDRSLVINSASEFALLGLPNLAQVMQAGDDTALREGVLGRIYGYNVRVSAGCNKTNNFHTKGTGSAYVIDGTGNVAVGSTVLKLKTGSGTIVAGDVLTIAGDANKYVVTTALTGALVTIQEPGLLIATADSAAVSITNSYTPNLQFQRNAAALVARPALQPQGAVAEQMVIADPQTGLSFLLLRVPQNGIASWFMRNIYDVVCPNPYAIGLLLG